MMEAAMDWMDRGGPVMWAILALSVLALAAVIDRFIAFAAFFRSRGIDPLPPQARLNRLQRGFGFISTVITAQPMLGILGTVTGIIRTFSAFDAAGAAPPQAATAGIGEALITTAAGLVAALALLFPYNMLLGMLSAAAARLEAGENGKDE